MKFINLIFWILVVFIPKGVLGGETMRALRSFITPYTISLVKVGKIEGEKVIVGSSYDGVVVCLDYNGNILWENPLSGFYNQDITLYDIDSDGSDEVLVANGQGKTYCIDHNGEELWSFKVNDSPMYSVCGMECGEERIVVCGGYDQNLYCLSPSSGLLFSVATKEFTNESAWGSADDIFGKVCSVNWLRSVKLSDGKELLALHGTVYANGLDGMLHLLDIDLEGKSCKLVKEFSNLGLDKVVENGVVVRQAQSPSCIGHFEVWHQEGVGDRVLAGGSGMISDSEFVQIDLESGQIQLFDPNTISGVNSKKQPLLDWFGYRTSQPFIVADSDDENGYNYFFLFGSRIYMLSSDMATFDVDEDVIIGDYSFNNGCVDSDNNYVILASVQSGGSCIHLIDINNPNWRDEMRNFSPPGHISSILSGTADLWSGLSTFQRPFWESKRPFLTYLSEDKAESIVREYEYKYSDAQAFYDSDWYSHAQERGWRDTMSNVIVKNSRDGRKTYDLTKEQSITTLMGCYGSHFGSHFQAGHGNDPHFFALDTWKELFSNPFIKGRSTVLNFSELPSNPDANFDYSMQTLLFPLANLRKEGIDVKMLLSNKDLFWFSSIYLDSWKRLLSGEYGDSFIPCMEETSARTQDISVAGRVGIWAAGCVDNWASRCCRDNPSYDRMREFSHQMLPNHYLRNGVYHLSLGATYIDNYKVNSEYMSILWEMTGKGLVYIPKVEEIVSFSPVHLAMKKPHPDFAAKGDNVKWTVIYGSQMDCTDNFVFDRTRAGWNGGEVTQWDFSRYAAGVVDRRANFIPPYPNGLVMITPGEEISTPYREPLRDRLHPLYRDIIKTYYTDGKNYLVNGVAKEPSTYYRTIEADIKESVKRLPINVEGDEVAWVAAQSAPNHIRLTIIDGGYINPDDRVATVNFNSVKPVVVTDLVTGDRFVVSNQKSIEVSVPTGLFRFLDVEIEGSL